MLRNDVGMLSGTVSPRSGGPVPATIVAIPERTPKASPKLGYYNPPRDKSAEPADGFMITSLAPGDYLVFAFDHAENVEYSNPDVLQNYISQATHVTLAPGQTARSQARPNPHRGVIELIARLILVMLMRAYGWRRRRLHRPERRPAIPSPELSLVR